MQPLSLTSSTSGNAVKNAATPVMDALAEAESRSEYTTLDASGLSVGLPEGVMGNSEVGHFTIGTGRVIYQVRGLEVGVTAESSHAQPPVF